MLDTTNFVLISIQQCLANAIIPQIRAITIDLDAKHYQMQLRFFLDGAIPENFEEEISVAMVELTTNSQNHYIEIDEIIRLDYPQKIPIKGRLAYLRYELILPKLKSEGRLSLLNQTFAHVIYRLDMQEALLGKVLPTLRHVAIDVNTKQKKLIVRFVYDGKISELGYKLANAAIQESKASFPDFEMDSSIERVDFPEDIPPMEGWLVYWRHEKNFTADGPVPSLNF